MKFNTITSSYRVKIKDKNKIFNQTVKIYSQAVWFICNVLDDVFLSLIPLNANQRINYIEHLIHNTSKNKASYDFDNNFINFPSYLRRAAISTAIGKYSSYYSNHKNWEINKIGKEPKLSRNYLIMPCFYKNFLQITGIRLSVQHLIQDR